MRRDGQGGWQNVLSPTNWSPSDKNLGQVDNHKRYQKPQNSFTGKHLATHVMISFFGWIYPLFLMSYWHLIYNCHLYAIIQIAKMQVSISYCHIKSCSYLSSDVLYQLVHCEANISMYSKHLPQCVFIMGRVQISNKKISHHVQECRVVFFQFNLT